MIGSDSVTKKWRKLQTEDIFGMLLLVNMLIILVINIKDN